MAIPVSVRGHCRTFPEGAPAGASPGRGAVHAEALLEEIERFERD